MKKIILLMAMLASSLLIFAGEKPTFPGGDQALNSYIKENTKYPQIARDNGIEGIVVVGFVVAKDGSISNAKVVKFIDPDLEKEALRVVNGMPAWIPAEKDGAPVEAPSSVEIPFIMD